MTKIRTSQLQQMGATTGQGLVWNGTDWLPANQATDASKIPLALVDAKGDLLTATANDVPARLGVGADGLFLRADSSTATGLAWGSVASPLTIQDKNVNVGTNVVQIDFQGAAVTAAAGSGEVVVTIPGMRVRDEGTDLLLRQIMDFVGAGVTATDDSTTGRTVVTIPGDPTATHNKGAWAAGSGYSLNDEVTNAYGLYAALAAVPSGLGAPSAGPTYVTAANASAPYWQKIANLGIDPTAPPLYGSRATITYTTALLAVNAREVGTILLAKGYRLYSITTTAAARVRLYETTAHRDADVARAVGVDPGVNAGLMLDYLTSATALTATLSPLVDGFDGKGNPDGNIPITVDNVSAAAAAIGVTLTYVRTE